MKRETQIHRSSGFALILVITLLGLLVLCVVSLSALVRVNGEISVAGTRQSGARQNALLGLRLALSELQRHAGEDGRVTGMVGISGVPAGGNRVTRHWCGVWRADGMFVTWLASGAANGGAAVLEVGVEAVPLVGAGSVGASEVESEHVVAGRVPIPFPAAGTGGPSVGGYAFVVLDEGVKVSAFSPSDRLASAEAVPRLAATSGPAQARLVAALSSHAARLGEVLSYEQLIVLPAPAASLTKSTLQDNFHHVTLTALSVAGTECRSGTININTTSRHVWTSLLETYNAIPGVELIPNEQIEKRGEMIAAEFAAETSGKSGNGPFTSVAGFGGSALLTRNLPHPVTAGEFLAALQPILTVRSDTFRIRAYGDAGVSGGSDAGRARAWCEAVVQRTPQSVASGVGRTFRVVYFRWLGPDDI
jgi:hypothetical protein